MLPAFAADFLSGQYLERLRSDGELEGMEQRVLDRRLAVRGLKCRVSLSEPRLGFDFRFSGILRVEVPLRQLEGSGQAPVFAARLQSLSHRKPAVLLKKAIVPDTRRNDSNRATAQLTINFAVGEGRYRLDWLVRNGQGQGCSRRHRFRAGLGRGQKELQPRIEPGEALFHLGETFGMYRLRPARGAAASLHLKILLNLPPFRNPDRRLLTADLVRMLSIVRQIASHPRVGKLDVVAFNLKDQRTIYEQRSERFVDYPELYHSISQLEGNEISVRALRAGADTDFLAELLVAEFGSARGVDAVILIGPYVETQQELAREAVAAVLEGPPPTYYLRYRMRPVGAGWGDAVTRFVEWVDGRTLPIYRPIDLWRAVDRMMGEISGGVE